MTSSIWDLRDNAKEALESDANAVFRQLERYNVDFLISHLSSANIQAPGAYRISRLHVREETTMLSRISRPRIEDVVRNHIKLVGRDGLLLDWVTLKAKDLLRPIAGKKIKSARVVFRIEADVEGQLSVKEDNDGVVIEVSQNLFSLILPAELGAFLEYLTPAKYNADSVAHDVQRAILTAHRYRAYEAVKAHRADLSHATGVYSVETDDEVEGDNRIGRFDPWEWRFIGTLQSACIYLKAGTKDGHESAGFITRAVACNSGALNSLAVFSAVHCDGKTEKDISDEIIATLTKESNGVVSFMKSISVPRSIAEPSYSKLSEDRVPEHPITIDPEFLSQVVSTWTMSVARWLTVILEWLRGSIHEGHPLNFCMVLADMSQVRDSEVFEIVPFLDSELPCPWDEDGKLRHQNNEDIKGKIIKPIKKAITKNNYAWFQDGKYALLWDSTFPVKSPQNLISIKNSSWNVFVNNCRHGKAPSYAEKILLSVAYVQANGSGGIIQKGEQILSFRGTGKWISGSTAREKKLTDVLKELGCLNDVEIGKIATAAIIISDDPHMGCMIAVMNRYNFFTIGERIGTGDLELNSQPLPFRSMGDYWKNPALTQLEEAPLEQMISLMVMDGATCVYWSDESDKAKISFRHLVVGLDKNERDLDTTTKDYLDGEGSRKWSAGIAACRPDVAMVIVVSQDGPIRVFRPNKSNKTEIEMIAIE